MGGGYRGEWILGIVDAIGTVVRRWHQRRRDQSKMSALYVGALGAQRFVRAACGVARGVGVLGD